jgi:ribosomal-protein-alanine N-acetyltransferase
MMVAEASVEDAPALAAVHAAAFPAPWTAEAMAALLNAPGVHALLSHDGPGLTGFILMRAVADEAEVLTLAVAPAHRRRGVGRALLQAGLERAAAAGAHSVFLEVADDNVAAVALYAQADFATVGRRTAYYARTTGPAADALTLRKAMI